MRHLEEAPVHQKSRGRSGGLRTMTVKLTDEARLILRTGLDIGGALPMEDPPTEKGIRPMAIDWRARPASCFRSGVTLIFGSAACLLAICHGARALDTCAGTYSGSAIHPLPSPNVVLFQPENNQPNAPTNLGDSFVTGLQRGGVVMTGEPTNRLSVISTVNPPPGITVEERRQYYGGGWAQDTSASAQSVVASTLQMSATLTSIHPAQIIWVASLSCRILLNDKGRVVESIGELLGRALGKELGPTRF
jgi:hypothetical protein